MSTLREFVEQRTEEIFEEIKGLHSEFGGFREECARRHGTINLSDLNTDVDRLKQSQKSLRRTFWLAVSAAFAAIIAFAERWLGGKG
jgi:hypothetical protein